MGEVDGVSLREEDFRWYLEHVASLEPALFLSMLKLAGEHTAEDYLADIAVPTLVIAAERDTFTPAALAEHMAQTIPDAELLMLQGASHAAPVEQPKIVADAFDAFERSKLV
jgi:pimeloyl-ACP methyl ester carboxylesterase